MEKIFLRTLFKNLHKEGLDYLVLRNYEDLPFSTNGSDLDVLINRQDHEKFNSILKKAATCHRGGVISMIPSKTCPKICVMGLDQGGWGLEIDLNFDCIAYKGHEFLSNQILQKNSFLTKNNIKALNPQADSLIRLLKEILNNGTCKKEYFDFFKTHGTEKEFLREVFSNVSAPKTADFLHEVGQKKYTPQLINKLSNYLNSVYPRNQKQFFEYPNKLKRLFKQPGYTIAFVGTDGAGKSSLIENLKPILSDAFNKSVYYEHSRPNQLPSLAALFKKQIPEGPVTDPHANQPSGRIASFLRWSYYLVDYTLGYFLKIWSVKAIRSCVFVFDRYYYDYLIDPKRGKIKLPEWVLQIGALIIPKPDLILCLGTTPEKIFKRKPELPLEEVKRQVKALKKFSSSEQNAVWIDTGTAMSITNEKALEAILKMMIKRFKKNT